MKRFHVSILTAGFAVLAALGLSFNINAQDPVPVEECAMTVDQQEEMNTVIQEAFDQLERDENGNIIPPDDWDVNCGGICEGGVIEINGVKYYATWKKSICVTALQEQGVENPSCFALLCGSDGSSDMGSIHMDQSEDAIPSRVVLTSADGQAPFSFPAKVRIEFFANMDLHGLPQLSNAEPMILESTRTINAWPPKNEVDYALINSVDFVSADGKDVATFSRAVVTMKNKSVGPLAATK